MWQNLAQGEGKQVDRALPLAVTLNNKVQAGILQHDAAVYIEPRVGLHPVLAPVQAGQRVPPVGLALQIHLDKEYRTYKLGAVHLLAGPKLPSNPGPVLDPNLDQC